MTEWREPFTVGKNSRKVYSLYDVEERVPLNKNVGVKKSKENYPKCVPKIYVPEYLLFNPNTSKYINYLLFDIDSEEHLHCLDWADLPEWNAMCENPVKGGFNLFNRLRDPVYIQRRLIPAEYICSQRTIYY